MLHLFQFLLSHGIRAERNLAQTPSLPVPAKRVKVNPIQAPCHRAVDSHTIHVSHTSKKAAPHLSKKKNNTLEAQP